MNIITRSEAIEQGLMHYFTGKPCVNGHISRRYISKSCVECGKERSKIAMKKFRKNNPERNAEIKKLDYEKNKVKRLATLKKWRENNKSLIRFHSAKRKKHIKRATPPWADMDKIKQIYLGCPTGHQVDHIIPLKGKIVSGLHVENNLQYLTPKENNEKKNKYVNT